MTWKRSGQKAEKVKMVKIKAPVLVIKKNRKKVRSMNSVATGGPHVERIGFLTI
jgi:hypothetical protein